MKPLLRRAAVAATAALTTLAIAAPSVGAASGPDVFAGEAEALALRLTLQGPAEIIGQLTEDGGDTLVQTVSFTTSELTSDGADAAVSLLEGLITEGVFTSSQDGASGSHSVVNEDLGALQVEGGTVEYVADATGQLSRSFSELAELRVSLAPLLDALPPEATEPLRDAVGEATDTVNGLVGELNGALGQVEEAVNQVTEQAPVDIPDVLPSQLPEVPDITQVDLLHARKMWSESTVTTVDDLVRSTATGGIVEASLLGGLIEVPTFQYTAWAETAGTPGTADAGTDVTTVAVRVGETEVRLDGDTLQVGDFTLDLSDPQLEGVPTDALEPVEEVLTQILDAAGLSISQGEGITEIAEDGSAASASTSAFALRVRPLSASEDPGVVDLNLEALPVQAAVAGDIEPAAIDEPALPRTGGGALSLLLGVTAMGAAGLLRRSR